MKMVAVHKQHWSGVPSKAYLDYYKAQAGSGSIPKFHGASTQYGYGLGGILRSIIRRIIPLGARVAKAVAPAAKKAFTIAKPHLKAAGKELATAAMNKATEKITQKLKKLQKGKGRSCRRVVKKRKAPASKRGGKRRRTTAAEFGGDMFS